MSLVRLAIGTRGWFGDSAVTPRLGIANAALSWAGHGRTVFTGVEVVVVGGPETVVDVVPGIVVVVDVLDVVVVEAEPVAVVTSSSGSAIAIPTPSTVRAVKRRDARAGTFIVHENNPHRGRLFYDSVTLWHLDFLSF
jgi:hypothetical protein